MANIIDITSYLDNALPRIKIGDTEYPVNDEKSVVLKVQNLLTDESADVDSFSKMTEGFELLLGAEAMAQLKEENPKLTESVSQMKVLIQGIMAAINGISYEEAEERFRY